MLVSLTLSSEPSFFVLEGAALAGIVTLDRPAPAGGVEISLTSSNTSLDAQLNNVVVPAGESSAIFDIDTEITVGPSSTTIHAIYRDVDKPTTFQVHPVASLTEIDIVGPSTVLENSSGGPYTLQGELAGVPARELPQLLVTWTTNSPAASINGAGHLTTSSVTQNKPVTITATYTPNGMTATKTIIIENVFVPVQLTVPTLKATGLRQATSSSN